MRAFGVVLLMAAICQLGFASEPLLNILRGQELSTAGDKIKELLEKLRGIIKNGSPENNVPVLDPLSLAYKEFNIDNEQLNLKGEIENLLLNGLSNFIIQDADFKLGSKYVLFDLLWSEVNGNTDYKVTEGSKVAGKFPVEGAGKFNFKITDFRFATKIFFLVNLDEDTVTVTKAENTVISVNGVKVDITGLYGDNELSELVSAVINENFADFMATFNGDLVSLVNNAIIEQCNKYLEGTSWSEIKQHLGLGK